MRILFVADIFAHPGRRAAAELIPRLIQQHQVDFCIANGENAAGGFGLTPNIARKLRAYGADAITTGNHVWDRPELAEFLDAEEWILRPLNYPPGAPGRGSALFSSRDGVSVGVVNLQGRTHMASSDCPFRGGRAAVEQLRRETPIVFVDFHAEATAEKVAMGWHLDGLASAVIGTHTHVQTADERILPEGTAYLTDAGMTGPHDSVIGIRSHIAIQRFIDQVPVRFKPASAGVKLCGALVDVDEASGRASRIERLQVAADFEVGDGED